MGSLRHDRHEFEGNARKNANNPLPPHAPCMPTNDKARKWLKPASGLYGRYQTGPSSRIKEGVVLSAGSNDCSLFWPQAKIKSKCQQPVKSKAMAEFAFPFLWQAPATCRQIHYIFAFVGFPAFLRFISSS